MQLYRQQSTRNLTEEEKTRIIRSLTLQNQILDDEKELKNGKNKWRPRFSEDKILLLDDFNKSVEDLALCLTDGEVDDVMYKHMKSVAKMTCLTWSRQLVCYNR